VPLPCMPDTGSLPAVSLVVVGFGCSPQIALVAVLTTLAIVSMASQTHDEFLIMEKLNMIEILVRGEWGANRSV